MAPPPWPFRLGDAVPPFYCASKGERTIDDLVPDTEPGMRVTGVVARTTSGKKG